ncbi:MAG: hypothetical protein HW380_2720 [Magnetococcales bacterium]|nr:hypothetical protein [Magnetococcales bacterium]
MALRRCLYGLVLMALTWGLFGCATGPGSEEVDEWPPQITNLSQPEALEVFRADQEKRRLLLGWWRVVGHMETSLKGEVQRHRMEMVGGGGSFFRSRVFGPFKNIVMELTIIPEWLRLVNPGDREVLEVAADSLGMEALTGMAFNPAWMLPAILGCTEGLRGDALLDGATLTGETQTGESLWVNAASGLVKRRRRVSADGRYFYVDYRWPKDPVPSGQRMKMPKQVEMHLDDGSRLTMFLHEWFFFSKPPEVFPEQESASPFQVIYPEIGEGIHP